MVLRSPGAASVVATVDANFLLEDDGDPTKILKFELSGITTGQTRTWTVPDANGTLVGLTNTQTLTNKTLTSPTLTTPALGVATGTSLATTGALTSSGTAGIGYAAGAGGTVTQLTSRSTGVTLSKTCGQITTTADSLAALGIVTFTVTNTTVAAADCVVVSKVSGDVDTFCWVNAVASGSFDVTLRNSHAVNADTTAFVFNFAVIKAVTS